MFVLLVHVEVRPGLLPEFTRAIRENAELSLRVDDGCLRFDVLQVDGEPTRWMFYEVYVDESAWLRHRESAHFIAYKAVADRALVSREVTRLLPLARPGAS